MEPETLLLVDNMIGLFDLMFGTLPIKSGQSFHVSALFPESLSKTAIIINVRPEQEVIGISGKSYTVFVCDIPSLNEIAYVAEDGTLVKIEIPSETPSEQVAIELAE